MNEIVEQSLISRTGPLSYGQRALWFLQKLTPASAAYNVMLAARANSVVDVPALRRAFQKLIDRHPSLRTTFPAIKGKPVQQVRKTRPVDFKQVDVSSLNWNELRDRLVEESHRPFDLETGPVLRVNLFTRSAEEHVLLLTMHHIVVDFLSFVIILDELGALYAAEDAGVEAAVPKPTSQYLDYANWQVEMLEGPQGEKLWAYWRKQLAGELPALNLPTDRPRLQLQTFRGATETFNLSENLARQLKSFAEAEGVSLFTALVATLQVLLYRYTGQKEILVGSPPVGTRKKEFQGVLGFFHNPVVLRADLSADPEFRTFLGQVRRAVADALDHQDYPFPLLVERLQPARDPSRSPLFQVMFVLYEGGDPTVLSFLAGEAGRRINLGGIELESLGLEQQAAMLDLTLTMIDSDGRVAASLQYNTDLFDRSRIARMIADLESLMRAAITNPGQRISDLPLSAQAGPVLKDEIKDRAEQQSPPAGKRIDFSLFYFASDDQATGDKYKLLIEGAKFADRHGFSAVWTPERHFHAFGGLYPNPSVTGAAIATITERIQIRAGSVVLPLHNPIRVAEEWSVVDNLSNGRVGLSFASGWHADDFVFAPENFANRRELMARHIETVRRLWRGEAIAFVGGAGKEVQVRILPRPVQRELPVWVTAFGTVETFQMAGEIGANMLTHLLGQSIELVEEKIAIYRKAWREHGHDGAGHVTLMLHTFVGEDFDRVREKVRIPFCNYLKSSLDLLIGLAKGAGLDVDPKHMTEQNIDALVTHAFNRYYDTCGLFGTPDTCLRMIAKLKAAGIDEVACLIDFGVDADSVMASLDYLNMVKEATDMAGVPMLDETAFCSPRTELEKAIAGIWREVIGVDKVGVEDNFFDLGGNPVLMDEIQSKLETTLNRSLSMMDMFKYLTISSLAKHLSNDRTDSASIEETRGRAETRRALMRRKQQSKANRTAVKDV